MPNELDQAIELSEDDLKFIAENIKDPDAIYARTQHLKQRFSEAGFIMFGPIETTAGIQFDFEGPLPDGSTQRIEKVY